MEAISKERYNEIVEFIQEHHRFGHILNNKYPRLGFGIKYVNATYDTRTKSVYRIELNLGDKIFTTTNIMEDDIRKNYDNLGDYLMAYLTGEISL